MPLDFEFSAEQEALRASVRRFLDERAPLSYVRQQWGDPVGTTDEVWRGLVDLGATGLLVPEDRGGSDAGMVTMGVVLEELGRAVLPGPFTSSAVAAPMLLRPIRRDLPSHELVDELLGGLADGSRRAAVLGRADGSPFHASADDRLRGTDDWVADAGAVDTFVVIAHRDGEAHRIYLVDADAAAVTPTETVDGTSAFGTVAFDDTPAVEIDATHVPGIVDQCVDATTVAAVVQGVGTAARALELAVEYAGQRHQFGKPIGSFQAVQHLCADMLVDLELGRAGAYYALWAADDATSKRGATRAAADARTRAIQERHRATTMAKAWASDAFVRIGATAIQVFGGIGYTWEHDIHLFYKRLLTLQHAGGGSSSHLDELAHLILD